MFGLVGSARRAWRRVFARGDEKSAHKKTPGGSTRRSGGGNGEYIYTGHCNGLSQMTVFERLSQSNWGAKGVGGRFFLIFRCLMAVSEDIIRLYELAGSGLSRSLCWLCETVPARNGRRMCLLVTLGARSCRFVGSGACKGWRWQWLGDFVYAIAEAGCSDG